MRAPELLVLYTLVALAVAWMAWRDGRASPLVAGPFWPLYLPVLIAERAPPGVGSEPSAGASADASPVVAAGPPIAAFAAAGPPVAAALDRLQAALSCWEPLPDGGGAAFAAAERGLWALARRRAEVEALLAHPGNDEAELRREADAADVADQPLYAARLRNLERLRALAHESRAELARALAGLEDLTTRVHLARLNGESTVDVARQLADLASAIDGAGEVRRLGRQA